VKKDNMNKLFKGKGFYISLLTGVLAVFAIAVLSLNIFSGDTKEDLADLNEPLVDIAEDSQVGEEKPKLEKAEVGQNNLLENNDNEKIGEAANTKMKDVEEEKDETKEESKVTKTEKPDEKEKKAPNKVETQSEEAQEKTVSVMTTKGKNSKLSFNEEKGLLWPLNGDVIMNYSMSNTIYFQTLAQYKCNPAIVISAKVGTKVLSTADAVVTNISNSEETGLTITTSIGSNYNVIYGQLKDVTVKKGDTIKEGQQLGTIAKPTKYYVVEGSNLYFKVEQNDKAVNPMLLLR
jgi:murein DD-endopeptidase MepM/ murein hydrolase activator NlpD